MGMTAIDEHILGSIHDELEALVNKPAVEKEPHPTDGSQLQATALKSVRLIKRLVALRAYYEVWRGAIIEQERDGKPKQYAFENLSHDARDTLREVIWYFYVLERLIGGEPG
jgi:hypothetical protein